MQLKFRQPILDENGNFIEFHIWGIGLKDRFGKEVSPFWKTNSDPALSQQYTGIFDRNGKEYCIGDAVLDQNACVAVLVWAMGQLCVASGEFGNYHAIDSIKSYDLGKCIIVGNTYENPNFLTEFTELVASFNQLLNRK